jgi:TonB-dependent SusC/RagA subfamily outer membrane receptor
VIEIVTQKPGTQKATTVIDGIEQRNITIQEVNKKYPKSDITSINVIKDKSAIGISAKNGVVDIATKKNTGGTPLIVIDNVKQKGMTSDEIYKKVNPSDIESINILKDQSAKDKYGDKGKNGVIEITTKKQVDTIPSPSATFSGTETPSSFRGGETAWRTYLEKNLNVNIPVIHHAPAGQYTVWLQFIIDSTGKISDLKPLTKNGFGMEEEILRILKKSPTWIPATQNGHNISSYIKQPVTFVVSR